MAFLGRTLVEMFASWLLDGTKGVTMSFDSTLELTSMCFVLLWKIGLLAI